jgi:hypothetical protein
MTEVCANWGRLNMGVVSSAGADIEKGKLVLDRLDARYANSGIVRFYKGRHCMVTQNVNAAIGMSGADLSCANVSLVDFHKDFRLDIVILKQG